MPLLRDFPSRPATFPPRPAALRPVAADESLAQAVVRTGGLVSPVWPLADYVAVNPFLGLVDRDWLAAREFLRSVSSCETLPALACAHTTPTPCTAGVTGRQRPKVATSAPPVAVLGGSS